MGRWAGGPDHSQAFREGTPIAQACVVPARTDATRALSPIGQALAWTQASLLHTQLSST